MTDLKIEMTPAKGVGARDKDGKWWYRILRGTHEVGRGWQFGQWACHSKAKDALRELQAKEEKRNAK